LDGSVSCPLGIIKGFVFYGLEPKSFIELSAIGVLLLCSAVIAAAEVSFFSLAPADFELLEQDKSSASQKLLQLLDKPKRLIATIVLSHNLVNIGVVIISEMMFDELFNFSANPFMGFIIEVVVVTFFILLIGEVIPKIFAARSPRKLALKLIYVFDITQRALTPFVSVLVAIASAFDKRIKQKTPDLSVDQLSQALELTSSEHTHEEERKILQGIVEFGNTEVSQIMKPRIDVVAFDDSTPFPEVIDLIIKNGFSRVPVYRDTLDQIVGVLFIKDLIAHLDKDSSFEWQTLLRPAFFVPESKKIDDLMKEFQSKKIHLAIVVDEYGGTNGIVTLEDVIEEVIGEINDEFDVEELVYSKLDENNYVFEAKIPLNDLYRVLDISGQAFEDKKGESDTLAGFILELSGKIPMKNEKIHFDNYIFTVESVDKRRIKRIKITIIKQEESGSFHEGGKIIPAILWPFLMLCTLLFSACNEDYVPKPRGYYRIDLPGNAYQAFQNQCPFSFEYSKYAMAESYQGEQKENCWYNIQYPKFKATIHLSYSAISSKKDLETQLNNSRTLAYKHTVKADGIDELPITYSSRNVYGLLYDLSGNSASQSQFYLTDSTKHFVRCALYFNSSPNADSIAPVLNFISKDIDKMIETFTWK
jgi:gliding motility-associated lipoprotein GldD